MIFPIGDEQVKGGHFPLFSYGFILLNCIVFFLELQQMNAGTFEQFIDTYGAIPAKITSGQDYFTLFTSMFLHADWLHIISNMLFLWVFADNIEAIVGNFRFVIFYLLGGLAAHAGHIYFNMDSSIVTVGASGAISAVMGAYLVMFPSSKVKVLILIFVTRVPAFLFLGFWIWQQFMGVGKLDAATQADTGGVAWWAHIGGFVFGVLAGFYFRGSGFLRKEAAPVRPSPYV